MTHYYGNFKQASAVATRMNRSKKVKGKFTVRKTVRGAYRVKGISSYNKFQKRYNKRKYRS